MDILFITSQRRRNRSKDGKVGGLIAAIISPVSVHVGASVSRSMKLSLSGLTGCNIGVALAGIGPAGDVDPCGMCVRGVDQDGLSEAYQRFVSMLYMARLSMIAPGIARLP